MITFGQTDIETLGQADLKTQVQEAVQRAISTEVIRIGTQIAPPAVERATTLPPGIWPILTSLPVLVIGAGLFWWLARPRRPSRSRK